MYKNYRPTSIWQETDRIQREMDSLFNRYSPSQIRTAPRYPALNIWVGEDRQVVSAEMPGLSADEINISVDGDTLTVAGKRSSNDLPEGAQYQRKERSFGEFSRSVRLPYRVDSAKVEATLKYGVLNIILPRAEADKPKNITIKGG